MPDFAEAFSRFSSDPLVTGQPPPPPEPAPEVTGPLASAFKRFESDPLVAAPQNIVPAFLRGKLKDETTWEQVAPQLKQNFGVDPEQFRQGYQLDEARAVQKGEGLSFLEALRKNSLPHLSSLIGANQGKAYTDALARFKDGKATGEDAFTIARYERIGDVDAEMNKTFAGKAVSALGSVPAVVGEFAAGGKVLSGLGKAAGIAPAVTRTGQIGQYLGQKAALTPLVPSMYVPHAVQSNIAEGRDALDVKALPTALTYGYANNLVLGTLQPAAGKLPVPTLGKWLGAGGIGAVEQAGVDAAGGLADDYLLNKGYKTNTKYGTLGMLKDGKFGEALQHATIQTLTFAAFTAMHGKSPDPVVKKFTEAVDAGKEAGHPPEKVAADALAAVPEVVETAKKAEPASPLDRLTKDEIKDVMRAVGIKTEKDLRARGGEKWVSDLVEQMYPPETPQKPAEAAPEPPVQVPDQPEIAAPDASGEVSGPEKGPLRLTDPRNMKHFDGSAMERRFIHDEAGREIGKVDTILRKTDEGVDLHIEHIGERNKAINEEGASLGRTEIRDILRQLVAANPTATHITGLRTSGARADLPKSLQRVRIPIKAIKRLVGERTNNAPPPKAAPLSATERFKIGGKKPAATPEPAKIKGKSVVEQVIPGEDSVQAASESAPIAAPKPDSQISEQAAHILAERAKGVSFRALGAKLGISHEQVRLIEKDALKKQGQAESMDKAGKGGRIEKKMEGNDTTQQGDVDLVKKQALLDDLDISSPEAIAKQKRQLEKLLKTEKDAATKEDIQQSLALLDVAADRLNSVESYLTDSPARTMPPSDRGAGTTGGGSGLGEEGGRPGRDHTSALANAKVDAARAERGLPPLLSEARKSNPKTWDEAMRTIDKDPKAASKLTDELVTSPRPTTTVESAILLHELVNLKNMNDGAVAESNRLYQEAAKLRMTDKTASDLKFAEFDRASAVEADTKARLDVLDRVIRNQGTEAGRYLQFRRQLVKEDYSLSSMLMRAEQKKGAPLTTDEKVKIEELQKQLAEIQEKLAASEDRDAKAAEELQKRSAEEPTAEAAPEPGMVEKAVKWLKDLFRPKLGARSKTWEYADQLEKSATAELSKKIKGDISFSNFDPTLIVPIAKYAAAKIIKTGLTFADFTKGLVNKFGEDVRPHLDAIWKQAQEHAKPDNTADLRIKVKQTKAKFEEMTDKMQRDNQSLGRRVLGAVGEGINVSRAIKTSIDLSMILRQGAFGTFSHPIRTAKTIGETLKAFVSEHASEKARDDIEQRENRQLYEKAGLDITDTGAATKQEEGFIGRLLKHNPTAAEWKTPWKLPLNLLKFGVSGSGRSYTTFLNRMRADMFDAAAATMPIKGKPTLDQAKQIANMVNVATGRGGLGAAEKAAVPLAQALFSPRFMMSRFQLLLATPLWRAKTPEVRKWIVKEYARAAVGVGVFYTLASLLNDDETITFDPRSTDFGKVKIKNTRLDPLAGLSQTTVFLTKLFGGEEVKDGKVGSLRDNFIPRKWITGDKETKVPFNGRNTKDVVFDFGRNKLAPVPGLASDLAFDRRDYDPKTHKHMQVTPGYAANQLLAPMGVEDVVKAMMDLGVPRGAAASLLAILGMGSQTYEPKPSKK